MNVLKQAFCVAVLAGATAAVLSTPAAALTQKECGVKYQAAKSGGTLNGQSYNDFRKAQCGADATAAAAPAAAPAAPAPAAPAPAAPAPKAADAKPAAAPAAPAMPAGPAVFPSKIDPKYASESVGKGRQHTCVDQYNANKATNGNGGMKWISKGGGYWSACDKALKGST
jgi:hypothetical protein